MTQSILKPIEDLKLGLSGYLYRTTLTLTIGRRYIYRSPEASDGDQFEIVWLAADHTKRALVQQGFIEVSRINASGPYVDVIKKTDLFSLDGEYVELYKPPLTHGQISEIYANTKPPKLRGVVNSGAAVERPSDECAPVPSMSYNVDGAAWKADILVDDPHTFAQKKAKQLTKQYKKLTPKKMRRLTGLANYIVRTLADEK